MLDNNKPAAPSWLMEWLLHKGFLMTKLQSLGVKPQLVVINEMWRNQIGWWEKNYLRINEKFLQREIIVKADEHICWYARTILPITTYNNHPDLFKRLKNEPLGNLLFDPKNNIKRTSFKYYDINLDYIEYHWLDKLNITNLDSILWMRVSTFNMQNKGDFYLAEMYLPGLINVMNTYV